MNRPSPIFALAAALLLSFANISAAADAAEATAAKPAAKQATKAEAKKPAAKLQLVDINSASKEALMKLPNLSAADAEKIIAGRPYGSKAWLVSHSILSEGTYQGLKALVIAKQPYADAAKNAALYAPKKPVADAAKDAPKK